LTGKAYREFSVWWENYQGGLTELEEEFAQAMTAHAKLRRRRRRIAVATAFVGLLAVLAVVGSFWQRSVRETRRAEAAHLVSLRQLELESYPSATVAHAITSLELADGPGARRLALEALWKGPTALVATEDFAWEGRFSPDGRWLVQARYLYADKGEGHLSIIRADGSSEFLENAHPEAPNVHLSMITHAGHFVSFGLGADSTREYIIWSVSGRRVLAQTRYEESSSVLGFRLDSGRRRLVLVVLKNGQASIDVLGFDGTQQRLGTLDFQYPTVDDWYRNAALDPRIGRSLAAVVENEVLVFEIGDGRLSEPRRLGRIDGAVADIALDPLGRFVTTADAEGEIRLWSLTETSPPAVLQGPPAIRFLRITIDGSLLEAAVQKEGNWISWVWALSENPPRLLRRFYLGKTLVGGWEWDAAGRKVARCGADPKIRIWSMDAPVDAEPLVLNRGNNVQMNSVSFNPGGSWLATADLAGLAVWPLAKRYSTVIGRHDSRVLGLDFAPSGEWLASSVTNNPVRLWPLEGNPPPPGRELGPGRGRLAASLDGTRVLVGSQGPGAQVLFPNGDPPLTLAGFRGLVWGVALSPDGRLAAAAGGVEDPADRVIRVWDVASGKVVTVLEVGERPYAYNLNFTLDGHLLSASESGLLRWDVATGERELLYQGMVISFAASADGRRVLMVEGKDASDVWGQAVLLELESSTVTRLDRFGEDVTSVAIDPAGTIAITGDRDGEVRVGSVIGEEPHLLLGHESTVWALAIDPRGRWIASGSEGGTIRLWPMPDLSKPPLHTLPHDELIAKLKTLTNLRVVRDEDSPTGWKLTVGPFPGWETVPSW
jgi:WD40 repeat protein